MATRLDGIVEVIEVGSARNANELLSRGYRLLVVEQVATGITRTPSEGGPNRPDFWVSKHLSYCFGREADQEPFAVFIEEQKQARKARDASTNGASA